MRDERIPAFPLGIVCIVFVHPVLSKNQISLRFTSSAICQECEQKTYLSSYATPFNGYLCVHTIIQSGYLHT